MGRKFRRNMAAFRVGLLLLLPLLLSGQIRYQEYQYPEPDILLPIAKEKQYKVKWTEYIAPAAFAFTAGAFQGTNEAIMHHYSGFKKVFPNANDQFWDPRKSWHNKWELDETGRPIPGEERFWLSSSAFVFTTDGYHLTDSGNYLFLNLTYLFTPGGHKPFKVKVGEVIGIWLCRKAGFHSTYSLLFKD